MNKTFLLRFSVLATGIIGLYFIMLCGHVKGAIVFPKQAEYYRDVAHREAIVFLQAIHPMPKNLKNLQLDKISVAMGHKAYWPDYRLGPSNALLAISVTSPGWDYMLLCGTNVVGVMGLTQDRSNHWNVGGAIFRGQPEPIWVGLEEAKKLPQVKSKDYEFRFLSLEGADYPMIWLHCDSDDILIPLSDGYGKWKTYKPYSENQIVKLLNQRSGS